MWRAPIRPAKQLFDFGGHCACMVKWGENKQTFVDHLYSCGYHDWGKREAALSHPIGQCQTKGKQLGIWMLKVLNPILWGSSMDTLITRHWYFGHTFRNLRVTSLWLRLTSSTFKCNSLAPSEQAALWCGILYVTEARWFLSITDDKKEDAAHYESCRRTQWSFLQFLHSSLSVINYSRNIPFHNSHTEYKSTHWVHFNLIKENPQFGSIFPQTLTEPIGYMVGYIVVKLMGAIWKNPQQVAQAHDGHFLNEILKEPTGFFQRVTQWVLWWVLFKNTHPLPTG